MTTENDSRVEDFLSQYQRSVREIIGFTELEINEGLAKFRELLPIQFGPKTLFHITLAQSWPSIKERGLVPEFGRGFGHTPRGFIFLVEEPRKILAFLEDVVEKEIEKGIDRVWLMLQVEIPRGVILFRDPLELTGLIGGLLEPISWVTPVSLPPDTIKPYSWLTSFDFGFQPLSTFPGVL